MEGGVGGQGPGDALEAGDVGEAGQGGEEGGGELAAQTLREALERDLGGAGGDGGGGVLEEEGVVVEGLVDVGELLGGEGGDYVGVDGVADGGHGEFVEFEDVEEAGLFGVVVGAGEEGGAGEHVAEGGDAAGEDEGLLEVFGFVGVAEEDGGHEEGVGDFEVVPGLGGRADGVEGVQRLKFGEKLLRFLIILYICRLFDKLYLKLVVFKELSGVYLIKI